MSAQCVKVTNNSSLSYNIGGDIKNINTYANLVALQPGTQSISACGTDFSTTIFSADGSQFLVLPGYANGVTIVIAQDGTITFNGSPGQLSTSQYQGLGGDYTISVSPDGIQGYQVSDGSSMQTIPPGTNSKFNTSSPWITLYNLDRPNPFGNGATYTPAIFPNTTFMLDSKTPANDKAVIVGKVAPLNAKRGMLGDAIGKISAAATAGANNLTNAVTGALGGMTSPVGGAFGPVGPVNPITGAFGPVTPVGPVGPTPPTKVIDNSWIWILILVIILVVIGIAVTW